MLNASVGVQRAIGRLRRLPSSRASSARTIVVGLVGTLHLQRRVRGVVSASRLAPRHDRLIRGIPASYPTRADHPTQQARISLMARIGHERTVAIVAAGILLGASVVSVSAARPAPATGGPTGPGSEVRIAVGGGVDRGGTITEADPPPGVHPLGSIGAVDGPASASEARLAAGAGGALEAQPAAPAGAAAVEAPFLDDGTLLKPVAVNTTVADGRDLMETYKVKAGDTLTGIASRFGVSMMTVWWANSLKSKDDLYLGQTLRIPPVSGLVVTVSATDTLDGLAARYEVQKEDILAINQLEDPNLIVGQVLMMPGALGKAIPVPKPAAPASASGVSSAGGRGGGSVSRPPQTYSGGAFLWPVVGGGNYVSQGYNGGHGGLDIAADSGSEVRATASGTVIFAGWKSNGGGYQVWIAHGSGLYSTYNHMSAISVGSGQGVSEGEPVGRVGQSGNATGPHLHFEVWQGSVWNGGNRVNPLAYL